MFIVTADQRPSWLADHPRVTVVPHSAIRPNRPLTFSSKSIEADLHNIPGLSENFIYLNDDVFLGPAFQLDSMFSSDHYLAHFETECDTDPAPDVPHRMSSMISDVWLTTLLPHYVHDPRPFAHTPRALRKSLMDKLAHLLPGAWDQARQEIFRQPGTPSPVADLLPRWMLATHQAQECSVPHRLIATGSAEELLLSQLQDLHNTWSAIQFFCLNDTLDNAPNDHPSLQLVTRELNVLFPTPSPFERV